MQRPAWKALSLQTVAVLGMLATAPAVHAVGGLAATSTGPVPIAVDRFGNVGYATKEDCDAAVAAGTAVFFSPHTQNPPLLRPGEVEVSVATLGELQRAEATAQRLGYNPADYPNGACDRGVGRSGNRDGVTRALIGTWVPFAATLPVNVYYDSRGTIVRATMARCDNNFAAALPRPIPGPKIVAAPIPPAPPPALPPAIVTPPAPAPLVAAPVYGAGAVLATGVMVGIPLIFLTRDDDDPDPVSP